MKTVTYTRTSTPEQSLDPQRIELVRYAEARGLEITHEYSDVISGAKARRPGLDALIAEIKAGRVKTVMAVKIDRIARSMIHFTELVELFRDHRCALVIPGQNIDTSTDNPAGELTMNILASIAAFERSLIRERTKAGLEAAKKRGIRLGRPQGFAGSYPVAEWKEAEAKGISQRLFCHQRGLKLSTFRDAVRRAAA